MLIYENTKELKLAGYTVVIPDPSTFALGEFLVGKEYKRIMGKQVTLDDVHIDESVNVFENTLKYAWFNKIAKYKGYVPIQEEIFTKLGRGVVKIRTDLVSCFVTDDVFITSSTRLLMYGPLVVG